MLEIQNLTIQIRNRTDIARLVGVALGSRRREICSAFDRLTRCEAVLDIEEVEVMRYRSEVWEVKIKQELPKCRLMLRYGNRGDWLETTDSIPQDVLTFLCARSDRDGHIISDRTWKAWQKMRWLRGGGRRLKGKSGEIHVVVEIDEVGRSTGATETCMIIRSIGAPYPDILDPVRLALPVSVMDVMAAVEELKSKGLEQLELEAA